MLAMGLWMFTACGEDETPVADECTNTNYTYTEDIGPIINASCATSGCHDGTSNLRPFTTYDDVYSIRFQLRSAINTDFDGLTFARNRLSEEEEEQILCWIKNDAPE